MTEPAKQDSLQTHVFGEDFALLARRAGQFLWAILAMILLGIFFGLTNQGAIYFLGGLLAFFGYASEMVRIRARRDTPVITIGSEGVSIPVKDIGPIPWDQVTGVQVRTFYVRGTTITGLDFRFREGTLRKWQIGRLGLDRWEIIMSIHSVFGKMSQIDGGPDALIASVERFHPVER